VSREIPLVCCVSDERLKFGSRRGQHIHHGYWTEETDKITKETAQIHLIELLLNRAGLPCTPETAKTLGLPTEFHSTTTSASSSDRKLRVLDVGCGVGGTTRYLAQQRGFEVTGITLSSEQVKIATQLTRDAGGIEIEVDGEKVGKGEQAKLKLGGGSVRFIQLDAEQMGDHFDSNSFDIVWISEALSHLPNKELFFRSSSNLLKAGGKLVIADWLKKPDLTEEEFKADIEPIEVGMLLPPLDTMDGYLQKASKNGLEVRKGGEPMDIGDQVKRTW
jgi:tocopherol O-methyltransferase